MENAYKKYKNQLLAFSLYVTGDRELSEDIVHEVFLKFASQPKNTINSTKDWLFISTRNLTYNNIKRLKRNIYQPINSHSRISIEQKILINQILKKLDFDERELILLKEKYGYSTKELASMLSISEENVRIKLFRIRKKMQKIAKE
ncbi:MAG: sigma-70 family RNA polymerase sigma factor [Calditrichaeota bacterium]|nr:MAG: sigma-70 family RNA polymerase sigma factor [Calditrichota bacterium]